MGNSTSSNKVNAKEEIIFKGAFTRGPLDLIFKLGKERTEFSVDEIKGATFVDCEGCSKLTTLPERWPETVTKINLRLCTALHGAFQLNTHLIIFKLDQDRTKFSVDEFPKGCTLVDCRGCKLTMLPEHFPQTVTDIYIDECPALGGQFRPLIVRLNKHLIYFKLGRGKSELLANELPGAATWVDCNGCCSLTTLPKHWRNKVRKINLSKCESLTTLPEHWPTSLTYTNLNGCAKLSALPGIPPVTLKSINVKKCDALPASVRNLGDFEVKSPADWHQLSAVLLAAHLQRSTTDLPVIEQFIESFLVDDFTPIADAGDDGERKGDGEDSKARKRNGRRTTVSWGVMPRSDLKETSIDVVEEEEGNGEKGGRSVTCSKFQDFVGGSLVAPVWQDEKRVLDKNQIKLPDSASRTDASNGNARLHRLTHIAHLANPAHDFLGALLSLPSGVQARLFKSEVSELDHITWFD